MSQLARPDKLVLEALTANVAELSDYDQAFMWEDAEYPFTDDNAKIIMVRMTGNQTLDSIRNQDCTVWIFSPKNSLKTAADEITDVATICSQYLYNNPNLGVSGQEKQSIAARPVQDVESALKTADNRYYTRFTYEVFS